MAIKPGLLMIFVEWVLLVVPGEKKGRAKLKKMNPRLCLWGISLAVVLGMAGELRAQLKEELLFQETPVVITASRKEQPITEAPTAITVVTAEDIRYSGAINIPDVLRMVAGVDVMTISARDQQVGVRGFIDPINNKLLVMVDGRSVYTDSYGHVVWDALPVGVEEIERIEIVKSPISSLYGANAFSGVINIITKSPQQLNGTTLYLTGGSRNTLIGTLLHAGVTSSEKARYKVSAQWDRTAEWGQDNGENAGENIRLNALAELILGRKGKLAFGAGMGHSKDRKLLFGDFSFVGRAETKIHHLQLEVEYGGLKFRTFFKRHQGGGQWPNVGDLDLDQSTYDAELVHTFAAGAAHSLVWGFNYRYNIIKRNNAFPQDYHQHLWAFFLEDEVTLAKKLRLILGGRLDGHPLVGERISPRFTIFYAPATNHILRFSAARAFRSPAFINSYLYAERTSFTTLPPPLPTLRVPVAVLLQGNQNLEPEGVMAYEMGYHSTWGKGLKLDVNLFYHRFDKFFERFTRFTYYGANEIFPGSPGGLIPKSALVSFENKENGWGIGGEIQLDFLIKKGISGFGNYSYQQITDLLDNPSTGGINETDRVRPEYPKHKLNAGLRVILKNKISLNLLAHWVAKTQRLLQASPTNLVLTPVADYLLVNTRLGYTFGKNRGELALAVFNLFNLIHYQYPPGLGLDIPELFSDEIGRRVTLTLRVKF